MCFAEPAGSDQTETLPATPAILDLEMPTPAEIKQRIEAAIPGARAEVEDYTGGGDHFRATVTAEAFAGRSRIDQHRLVYEVFGAEIGGPIHALSLKTETG
jgi:stress-induced morphogen